MICHTDDVPYNRDIESSLKYHRNVTANGYRALVYRSDLNRVDRIRAMVNWLNLTVLSVGGVHGSGDHDAMIPHLGTQA